MEKWKIRPKYKNMVERYEHEKDLANKIQMKHKFIYWFSGHHNELTDAEIEYLQKCICKVEDLYF